MNLMFAEGEILLPLWLFKIFVQQLSYQGGNNGKEYMSIEMNGKNKRAKAMGAGSGFMRYGELPPSKTRIIEIQYPDIFA